MKHIFIITYFSGQGDSRSPKMAAKEAAQSVHDAMKEKVPTGLSMEYDLENQHFALEQPPV